MMDYLYFANDTEAPVSRTYAFANPEHTHARPVDGSQGSIQRMADRNNYITARIKKAQFVIDVLRSENPEPQDVEKAVRLVLELRENRTLFGF